jgi:hypothetical protein
MPSNQTSHSRADHSFEQIVSRISPEARVTLTAEQLDALRLAFRQVNWKNNHAIDIRLSIPGFHRSFYVVFLAGKERRSAQRLRAEMPNRRKMLTSLTAFALLLGGCTAIGYGLFQFALATSQRDKIHPTAIPWLQTKAACEQTGRVWENSQCWDAAQSPDF